jgi:Zn-dependent protease
MQGEPQLRFRRVVQVGTTSLGLAPGWLAGQALGLAAFSAMVYATVAGQLGVAVSPLPALAVGLVLLGALDLTLLVHEAGHALAARFAGAPVRAIVLMAYGGATIRGKLASGLANRLIAAAGPLANLTLAAICGLLLLAIGPVHPIADVLIVAGGFQAITAALNLLPFGHLDGSRIVRSSA